MGLVVDPVKAFGICHGYKIDNQLILWSEGVVGALSDDQELKCQEVIIENTKGGPKRFNSVGAALHAKTVGVPEHHLRQVIAIRQCASILDKAEDKGLISGIGDVYGTMDYCMERMGFSGKKKWPVRPEIKEFVDKNL